MNRILVLGGSGTELVGLCDRRRHGACVYGKNVVQE